MFIQKNKKVVKASRKAARPATKRPLRAAEEIEEEIIEEQGVVVEPEASDLLFEAEDVAELVAEVTGMDVAVTAEDDVVTFEIGDDQYTVEAEGDEEALESSTRIARRGKAPVKASRKVASRKAVRARR